MNTVRIGGEDIWGAGVRRRDSVQRPSVRNKKAAKINRWVDREENNIDSVTDDRRPQEGEL